MPDSINIPEHYINDCRSAFLSIFALSLYVLVTLLGSSDADLIGGASEITLPLFNVSTSASDFFWISALLVSLLTISSQFISANLAIYLHKVTDGHAEKCADRIPIYMRWGLHILDHSNSLRTSGYLVSVFCLLLVPIFMLVSVWWRSHVSHDIWISSLIGGMLIFVLATHIALSLRLKFADGGMHVARILGTAVLAMLVSIGVVALTLARTGAISTKLVAKANLEYGHIVPSKENYVPRFVWVQNYNRKNGLVDAGQTNRGSLEDEWFDRRQYYIRELGAVDFDGVDLSYARMNHAFLAGSRLRRANLEGATMTRVDLESVDASNSLFRSANLAGAHLEQSYLVDADFEAANLNGAYLSESTLHCANFSKARLFGAKLQGAFMDATNFSGADLRRASLVGAYAKRANFNATNFENANLTGAVFWGSNLSTAIGLTQEQLNAAVGDEETLLPEGLTIPKCFKSIPVQPLPFRLQWWIEVGSVEDRLTCPWTGNIALNRSVSCE